MKTLIYIPTGLNTPELEVLISKTQSLIDQNNAVTILLCSGAGTYACSKNLLGLKFICYLCKKKRNKGISLLKGNYKILYTPKITKKTFFFKNYKKLLNFNYKNVDVGLGVYGSYVGMTRDMNFESFFAKDILSNLTNTSVTLTDFFKDIILSYNYCIIFNGRMNQYRPLYRIAQQNKIKLSNLEFKRINHQIFDFKNKFSMDLDNLAKLIKSFWKKKYNSLNNKALHNHYISKLKGEASFDAKSFVLNQKKNLLPDNWDKNKKNIVYFTASNDELISYGKEYNFDFYKDQNDAIFRLAKSFQNKNFQNYHLWIRMHPNLSGVRWNYVNEQKKIGNKFNNVTVIDPDSKISSYAFLFKSDIILGSSSSSTLIEANYWKKPNITVGPSIWSRIYSTNSPRSHKELVDLIRKKNIKIYSREKSLMFAAFWLFGGSSSKYLTANSKFNYFFRKKKINFNFYEFVIYFFLKAFERFVLNYFKKNNPL
jgi:hypothetical protein